MIPSDIRVVAAMPRTTSGKIDRVRVKSDVLRQNEEAKAKIVEARENALDQRQESQWKRA
jgi:acyl-CoA synthetase (AMP-forming)/AMP-acid ligase II